MRLMIDTLIVAMLITLISVMVQEKQGRADAIDHTQQVRSTMQEMLETSMMFAATHHVPALPSGYAEKLKKAWFVQTPVNPFVDRPSEDWVNCVSKTHRDKQHPAFIVAGGDRAPFWYNGHRGIVRARVSMQGSQHETLMLYNRINGTNLTAKDCQWDLTPQRPAPAATADTAAEGTADDAQLQDESDPSAPKESESQNPDATNKQAKNAKHANDLPKEKFTLVPISHPVRR